MKNIFVKTALVLAAALISFGASADTTKHEKRTDGVIARSIASSNAPAMQLFTPEKENTAASMPIAKTVDADFAANVPENVFTSVYGEATLGIQAAAEPVEATDYTSFIQEGVGLVYIIKTASYNLQYVFNDGITELELGRTYTFADMNSDYTGYVKNSRLTAASDASFLLTKEDGLVRIECSVVSGTKTYAAVFQEIAVPTPTKTVTFTVPASDMFDGTTTSSGLFEFYGYSEDKAFMANCTVYANALEGEHTVERFYKDYTYVREFDDAGDYTQYDVLAFDGPVTVTKVGKGYTCHARMICENAVLYDVTFDYVPHMDYDTNSDVEVEFTPSQVTVNTSTYATDGGITVSLNNGEYSSMIKFYAERGGEAKIAPGTYTVSTSKDAGTILACPGVVNGKITPSFIGTLASNGSIDDVWFIEEGTGEVVDDSGQLNISIDALNSYGKSVKIKFKSGEKTGSGWGEWKDFAPEGDATGYYYYSGLFDSPGIKSDIPVQIRQDIGNPVLAQIKLVGWASDVFVEGKGSDLVLDWNMETNKVRVAPQTTGIHNTNYDEDILITDIGYGYMESYLPYYPCEYDPELGRFNLNVLYTTESMLGSGRSFNTDFEEFFQMDGFKDYTFDGWISSFKEDENAGTAVLGYSCFTAGVDVEYGMKYALVNFADISTKSKVDPDKIAAVLAGVEESLEWGAEFELPSPGTYYVLAGSLDDEGEYSGNYDLEKYQFVSSKDWKTIGVGEYTDDLVIGFYNLEPITYDVEIQENVNTPGFYRVKNMFGAAYPYNEDPSQYREDSYVYIDATNPNKVTHYSKYPTFIGLNWGDGELMWEASEPGTLVDNVITFPAKGLGIFGPDGSGYYANRNGAFKLVIKYETPLAYEVSGSEAIVVASGEEYEEELKIPEKTKIDGVEYTVTKIGTQAFAAQYAVTSIVIPATVNEINASAFSLCVGVKTITCTATVPPTCGATAFYKINPGATVKVPAASVEAYKAADGWKMFANIEAISAAE